MFGYVAVNQPELKVKDYNRYREYYCGVCHALREAYGISGQISLTYDAAFAAILLSALYEPKTERNACRCIVHPVGKKNYLCNSAIEYAADMNLVLGYYKCLDDWEDDKDFIRLSYSGMIRSRVKHIKQKYGKKVAKIRDKIKELAAWEAEMQGRSGDTKKRACDNQESETGVENIDVPAGIFGDIMRIILSVKPQELYCSDVGGSGKDDTEVCSSYCGDWSKELGDFGYQLGKFIYILDAYDDVGEDIKKGHFNPFAQKYRSMEKEAFQAWVGQLLMMIAADMAKVYEKMPIVEEVGILRNIIYSGIWCRFYQDRENTGKHHIQMEKRNKNGKVTGNLSGKDRQYERSI